MYAVFAEYYGWHELHVLAIDYGNNVLENGECHDIAD